MTNQHKTVLYVGMTNNLIRRGYEHKTKRNPNSFTARYNCDRLVWYEITDSIMAAVLREKQIKGGNRAKKEALINDLNPGWNDLYPGLLNL